MSVLYRNKEDSICGGGPSFPFPALLLVVAICWGFFAAVPAFFFGLPEWFLRLDLLLVWTAFAFALFRGFRHVSRTVKVLVGAILTFGVLELATALYSGITLIGAALSFSLYALPLAVVATLLLTPPGSEVGRKIIFLLLALAFIEVPVSIFQTLVTEHPDFVSGTFPGLELGSHLNGVLVAVASLWILGRASSFRATLWAYPLLIVLLVTDTKQVALLLPVALALAPAVNPRAWLIRLVAPVLLAVATLLAPPIPTAIPDDYRYGPRQIQRSASGESRKSEAARLVADRVSSSPGSALLGLGQGQSVSYIALLSDGEKQTLGPSLGLEPSRIVTELPPWDGAGSFYSEFSSLVGMIGDLGFLGFAAFVMGLAAVGLMVWRTQASFRGSAQALSLLYLGLGLLYIWWEQPVFGLYISLFIGLAILGAPASKASSRSGVSANFQTVIAKTRSSDSDGVGE